MFVGDQNACVPCSLQGVMGIELWRVQSLMRKRFERNAVEYGKQDVHKHSVVQGSEDLDRRKR